MAFIWITLTYVVLGFSAVGIFLWGKPDGNSLFDRAYRVVCVYAPRLLKKGLEKCCGKRAPKLLDAIWTYLCFTSNPLVQVFYVFVVVGGYLVFVAYGFPHLPNRLAGVGHKYVGTAVFLTSTWVWWKACRSDPGVITPANVEALTEFYPWDEQIFTSTECKTCNLIKPGRSKHCSLCDACVAKFDHHCIWINNCVGVGNHKYFLGFLFSHLVLCFYGCGMGSTILYEIVVQKDLFSAVFVDPVTRERHQATYLVVFQYMLATEGMVLFVSVLCCVMGLVLCGFFLWHLNLVRVCTTTNELSKWNYVKWCLKQDGPEGVEKWKAMRNVYNEGCIANFREVFFPIDVHNMPDKHVDDNGSQGNGSAPAADKRKGKVKKG